MERKQANALIYMFEDKRYMYLASNIKENYYIELLEDYGLDSDLDINFPSSPGIYEVIVELNPTDDAMVATILESKLVHDLKL